MFSLDSPTDGGGEFLMVFGIVIVALAFCFAVAMGIHAAKGDFPQQRTRDCVFVQGERYCR